MALPEEKVQETVETLIKEANLNIKVMAVVYREDYQDYVVVIGKRHYTDLREKLMNDYIRTKFIDFRNEIIFKLKHPIELDEFQMAEMGIVDSDEKPEDKIELDTREDNDWL